MSGVLAVMAAAFSGDCPSASERMEAVNAVAELIEVAKETADRADEALRSKSQLQPYHWRALEQRLRAALARVQGGES